MTHLIQQLKAEVIDSNWNRLNVELKGVCAQMILEVENQTACWQVFTEGLRRFLSCDRIDAGPCTPMNNFYEPIAQANTDRQTVMSVTGLQLPNQILSIQTLWSTHKPLVCDDIRNTRALEPELVSMLTASGTHSMVATAIFSEATPVGLVCMDYLNHSSQWEPSLTQEALRFVSEKASRILNATSQYGPSTGLRPCVELLSPTEKLVAHLAGQGLGYKAIARERNVSVSTVDHQLRSIRHKLGVSSHAKLILAIANSRD